MPRSDIHRTEAVVITGIGAISPHGHGASALWDGVVAGRPTAAPIRAFDATDFGVRFACEAPQDLGDRLPRRLVRQTDRFAQLALLAAMEALGQAGLVDTDGADALRVPVLGVDPERVGAVIASGVGGIAEITTQHVRLMDQGPGRVRPYTSIAMPINMGGGQIAIRHGLGGPVNSVVSACASATDAIGQGGDMIRAGRADIVVVGGAEAAVTPFTMAAFDAAQAMSRRNDDPSTASRPFDIGRDGFVTGEGAGVLVLERASHAAARGATALAVLAGYGASNDAHDPTRPLPGGRGAVRAMRLAIDDARLVPNDIDHVNAHGTSTPLNDAVEAAAINAVFDHRPPVTSIKSSIGHLLGAAGAVEAVAGVQTIGYQTIPPTINLDQQDPDCDVDVVRKARRTSVEALVSNSFGFGGHNAVIVLTADSSTPTPTNS